MIYGNTAHELRETPGRERGFTLVELLIVVVILGILAALAIPQYAGVRDRSYDAAARSDLRNLMTAQELYFSVHEAYTTTLSELDNQGLQTSPGVESTIQLIPNGFRADASHRASDTCFRVEVSRSAPGTIEEVDDASVGSGECGG